MTSDRKPSLILPVAVAALLLGGYIGAYYATARVRPSMHGPFRDRLRFVVDYRCPASMQGAVRRFFAPIHAIDRRIRAEHWGGDRYDPRGKQTGAGIASPPRVRKPRLAAEILKEENEIEFLEVPIDEALAFLSDLHQIEIRLDPSVNPSRPITGSFSGISLQETLTRILRPLELSFRIEENAIRVGPIQPEAMPSDHKHSLIVPVAVTLAVLLALYVGAYYAMAFPVNGALFYLFPSYGPTDDWGEQTVLKTLFTPIHCLDRRIRPHVWDDWNARVRAVRTQHR